MSSLVASETNNHKGKDHGRKGDDDLIHVTWITDPGIQRGEV